MWFRFCSHNRIMARHWTASQIWLSGRIARFICTAKPATAAWRCTRRWRPFVYKIDRFVGHHTIRIHITPEKCHWRHRIIHNHYVGRWWRIIARWVWMHYPQWMAHMLCSYKMFAIRKLCVYKNRAPSMLHNRSKQRRRRMTLPQRHKSTNNQIDNFQFNDSLYSFTLGLRSLR